MKILVVDDEPLARDRLLRLLARIHPEAELLEAADGSTALESVQRDSPDLVLLDIRMPGMDGLEVAGRLKEMPCPPAVLFCTAYDEYALKALKHQAAGYLLKPVREPELAEAIDSAGRVNRVQLDSLDTPITQGHSARQVISSQSHRGLETLDVADIRYFTAREKYVLAVSAESELLIPDSLKDLEDEFGQRFLRVHRNTLVAVAHIQRLQKTRDGTWNVVLDGVDYKPPISRRHLSSVKATLTQP